MRLIDADKFFEDFKKISFMNVEGHPMVAGSVVLMLLDSQPTAFNVDKVVEELEKKKNEYLEGFRTHNDDEMYGVACGFGDSIDIVRKGGVE